jgi:uncharacterized protein (TIGR00369 family)
MSTLVDSPDPFVGAIPLAGLTNPVTGAPTIAPLAVLVDFVAGLVNHYRRAAGEWTVSSELSLELSPDALTLIARQPDLPVIGSARPSGPKGATSLGVCEILHGDTTIGIGSVRSVHICLAGEVRDQFAPVTGPRPRVLADIMALRVGAGDPPVLFQSANTILNNSIGIVHGGISAAGLELAASAALNLGRGDEPLNTASIRVNYLRRFVSGDESHYAANVLHAGRRSGIAEASAISSDGEVALISRVTAYR